jgi:hypothetical protein
MYIISQPLWSYLVDLDIILMWNDSGEIKSDRIHGHGCKLATSNMWLVLWILMLSFFFLLVQNPCVGHDFLHGFVTGIFSSLGLLAPFPIPSLENQGLHFIWSLPFDLSSMGGPIGSLCFHQHSSPDDQGWQTFLPWKGCSHQGECFHCWIIRAWPFPLCCLIFAIFVKYGN